MRLKIGRLRQVVKQDLPVEFTGERLTSYGGLELVLRKVACARQAPSRPGASDPVREEHPRHASRSDLFRH